MRNTGVHFLEQVFHRVKDAPDGLTPVNRILHQSALSIFYETAFRPVIRSAQSCDCSAPDRFKAIVKSWVNTALVIDPITNLCLCKYPPNAIDEVGYLYTSWGEKVGQ